MSADIPSVVLDELLNFSALFRHCCQDVGDELDLVEDYVVGCLAEYRGDGIAFACEPVPNASTS
ncbi:hypothetical protein [Nocardia abscessus]|uniref:hypothetical protein n=1 Tax=Nocardia abscessus TaxID=120957 RepID=UPI002457377E|nr:hypothetical protein [Nocardia abscessus]